MSVGRWSTETYRLDEITKKFNLPCVVCFSEGYMDATESESISKDDVIKIDKRVILQKVAADFVNDLDKVDRTLEHVTHPDDPYVELRVGEILIPLNYNGTVKACHSQQICHGVDHLQRIFPRYAQVLSNIVVTRDDGKQTTIQAGSFIELDRTIPSFKSGPDHLVFSTHINRQEVSVTIPVTKQGKFKTLPDENEYTLNEVINRYGFPVVVTFIDDEIKHLYTMDIEEGIDNMKLISATVKLKRLEQQDAIIGHYKPLEENQHQKPDSEYFARRSLVVLPLDNSDIREIQVHVLLDSDEEVYDEIFLVSNKSHELNQVLDGTLYVDFSKKSGPRRIGAAQQNKQKVIHDQAIPPRPPKSAAYHREIKQKQSKSRLPKPDPLSNPLSGFEDYEEVSPPPLPKQPTFSAQPSTLADMDFDKYRGIEVKEEKLTKSALQKLKNKVIGGKGGKEGKQNYYHTSKPLLQFLKKDKSVPSAPQLEGDKEDELPVYDYPDAEEIAELSIRAKRSINFEDKQKDGKSKKPVAHISPHTTLMSQQKIKAFSTLTKVELEKRLIQCGMTKFAAVCREKGLDGKFFDEITNDILQKEPFSLSPFDLVKLDRVKQDWIPS